MTNDEGDSDSVQGVNPTRLSVSRGDIIQLPGSTISLLISELSDEETRERQPLLTRDSISQDEGSYRKYVVPCLAELSGTMMFVFIGTMSINTVNAALAHGLTIFVLVSLFGHISGGHFNPAVTFGVALVGGVKPALAFAYVICQLLGGMIGAAFTRVILDFKLIGSLDSVYVMIKGGATLCDESVEWWQGFLVEILLTGLLVFTVLITAVDQKHMLAPLAIGVALAVSIFAGGSVSGASLNPARSLGPAVAGSALIPGLWRFHYIYWAGPLLGAAIAAMEFKLIYASEEHRYKKSR